MHLKRSAALSIALLCAAGNSHAAPNVPWRNGPFECYEVPVLQSGDLVAICGDSITEAAGYSVYMADYLLLCQPAPKLGAMQFGWGGERAGGFLQRIERDVLPFSPMVVTTSYGMNDGGYSPLDPKIVAKYRDEMDQSIASGLSGHSSHSGPAHHQDRSDTITL